MPDAPYVDRHIGGKRKVRDPDEAILDLARRQHGVLARRQLLELGVGPDAIDFRLRRGRLLPLHRAVYAAGHDALGDQLSVARSQPYYVDVTHPRANNGDVARFLSARYGILEEEIATIGDMPNDVLMFAHSGLSVAMGNAHREVQRAARQVTTSNDEEGFANAVERFILR